MNHNEIVDQPVEEVESSSTSRRHAVTMENSPEETIRRMRSLPERAARFKELLNAFREAKIFIPVRSNSAEYRVITE